MPDATLPAPEIGNGARRRYRLARLREQMEKADVPLCVLTNPVSMRSATGFRNYRLFQSRNPIADLFVPLPEDRVEALDDFITRRTGVFGRASPSDCQHFAFQRAGREAARVQRRCRVAGLAGQHDLGHDPTHGG